MDENAIQESLGARLRRLRIEADLSPGALAAAIQTPSGRSLVAAWEADRAVPSSRWAVPLADALGVSVRYLLTGQDAPQAAPQAPTEDKP